MWNRQSYFSFYFFKCMRGSGRGASDDTFCVLYLIRASELWFGSWWEVVSTLRPYLCCQTEVCAQHDVSHTVNTDKGGSARRLSSSWADTYVVPACGYKAMLAEALVWADGVHAAGVFAGTDTNPWLCALIDVWGGEKDGKSEWIFKDLLQCECNANSKSPQWI